MTAISLVLVVHDNQPVGNFDEVLRRAYADACEPFLAFLERRPTFRVALHISGPLLQGIGRHRREYLARLEALVDRARVERWGGAFFEPILAAIPGVDRRGKIRHVAFVDEWAGRRLDVRLDRAARLERAPIETVSLSEGGAEGAFQGVEARPGFAVTLESGAPWRLTLRLATSRVGAAIGAGRA